MRWDVTLCVERIARTPEAREAWAALVALIMQEIVTAQAMPVGFFQTKGKNEYERVGEFVFDDGQGGDR